MKNAMIVLGTLLLVVTVLFGLSRQTAIGQEATATPAAEATTLPAEEGSAASAQPAMTLPEVVRQSTAQFQDLQAAQDAGYGLVHGCVSGAQSGAMGVHYANGDLVGDGTIDAAHPEVLVYEQSYGELHLVGVEYIVPAEQWHENNDTQPVVMGQLYNYVSSPNRYGSPAFYELHVWAWKHNPDGVFADWNPQVSCEEYTEDTPAMSHE